MTTALPIVNIPSSRRHAAAGRKTILMAICAAAWIGAGTCADARPANIDGLDAVQSARISDICQTTMGMRSNETHYDACVASLASSLRGYDRDVALRQGEASCRAKGLETGSPALADCILGASQAGATPAAIHASDTAFGPEPVAGPPAKSYFYASPREVHAMEEHACAQLGFDPADRTFVNCVVSLQSAVLSRDHPMN